MSIVILSPKANKEFIKLPRREKIKVDRKLKSLSKNPFTGKPLTGELKNFFSCFSYCRRLS